MLTKEIQMHTIWFCVPNNQDNIERMFAKIGSLGVNISPAASDHSLYHKKEGAKTTILAISVNNFNTKLDNTKILDIVCDAIKSFTYYGVVMSHMGSTNWRAGNVTSQNQLDESISSSDSSKEKPKKEKVKKKEKPKVTDPQPEDKPKRVDLKLLAKIVEASCSISDVFFDGIPQADRKLLSRELQELCENPKSTIEDLSK